MSHENRLLTRPEELDALYKDKISIAEAQDTKTHGIDDAECQKKINRLIAEIEADMFFFDHDGKTMGLTSSGNKSYRFWQTLKAEYGVKS